MNDANTDTVYNGATNWNGGGMHTSHDYGFGDVDARAANDCEWWIAAYGNYQFLRQQQDYLIFIY